MKQRIKELKASGKTNEEIKMILLDEMLAKKIEAGDDTAIKNNFEAIAVSIKQAADAFSKNDIAHLTFTINCISSMKKLISELEKQLVEKKEAIQPSETSPIQTAASIKADSMFATPLFCRDLNSELKAQTEREIKDKVNLAKAFNDGEDIQVGLLWNSEKFKIAGKVKADDEKAPGEKLTKDDYAKMNEEIEDEGMIKAQDIGVDVQDQIDTQIAEFIVEKKEETGEDKNTPDYNVLERKMQLEVIDTIKAGFSIK